MTTNLDFTGALDAISELCNPEIWHVRYSTHPGIGWSIKTVIPSHDIADDSVLRICDMWSMVSAMHPEIVTITKQAFDWNGSMIKDWKTVWVTDGSDVSISFNESKTPIYEITTIQDGYRNTASMIVDNLSDQLANSNEPGITKELGELLDIAEAIGSQVSEFDSQKLRSGIHIVDE
jgi:hypothetical protein